MSPEKTDQLHSIFPEIFQRDHDIPTFFECSDGWFDLLKDLIEEIKGICQKDNLHICVTQVKEKYGTLRFYLSEETDEISSLVLKAQRKSASICEQCGKSGVLRRPRYWMFVSCDECYKEENS
jgi:hypothetical protein